MNKSAYIRFVLSLLLMTAMLSPVSVLAMGDGKKHFKEGMDAEVSEDWDKAAEQFALAITDNPKNPEYRLHYTRALFNASQMYIRKGNALANEKDFKGAYDRIARLTPTTRPTSSRNPKWTEWRGFIKKRSTRNLLMRTLRKTA